MFDSLRIPCKSHLYRRPPQGKAVSHRRPSLPRAGSPTYWAPRLDVPSSRPKFRTKNPLSIARPNLSVITTFGNNLPLYVPYQGSCPPRNYEPVSLPPPCTYVQEGENTLGIAQLRACPGRSQSGPIKLTLEISVQAVRCNGLHPGLGPRDQTII
jgi:hypothetical protein